MSVDQVAKVEKLCRSYLAAVDDGDLEALLANFTADATATSPIYGEQSVHDFYSFVMRVTSGRAMKLKTIFFSTSEPLKVAVHMAYSRKVEDGKLATIDVVDIFGLTEDLGKFSGVTIIYDTAPVRSDFDKLDELSD